MLLNAPKRKYQVWYGNTFLPICFFYVDIRTRVKNMFVYRRNNWLAGKCYIATMETFGFMLCALFCGLVTRNDTNFRIFRDVFHWIWNLLFLFLNPHVSPSIFALFSLSSFTVVKKCCRPYTFLLAKTTLLAYIT